MNIQEEEKIIPQLKEGKKKKNKQQNKNKNKKNSKKEKAKEFTFVLATPLVFLRHNVGAVVQGFTDIGLNVIDLRCMSVTRKFLAAHLRKRKRGIFSDPVLSFVNYGPFIAMKLEGDDVVNKAFQVVTTTTPKIPSFWNGDCQLVYSSKTVDHAREDAEMWFQADPLNWNWKDEAPKRKDLMFVLYDGTKCGGSTERDIEIITNNCKIDFRLERASQRFILIKQEAFQDGMMPKLLSFMEQNYYFIRGLKLVKKSEAPHSVVWSVNSSPLGVTGKEEEEEFGIALIVSPAAHKFEGDCSKFLFECVTRGSVYLSEEGDWLELAKEFFQFGVVGWRDPESVPDNNGWDNGFCGGLFESTLTGLVFD